MLAMMKRKAAALDGAAAAAPADAAAAPPPPPPAAAAARAPPPTMLALNLGPVGSRMHASLDAALSPSSLTLIDESDQHAGHAGAKGLDGESHFAVTIVSEAFEGVRALKRHQMVYAALGDDMKAIHALSIKAIAPGEEGA